MFGLSKVNVVLSIEIVVWSKGVKFCGYLRIIDAFTHGTA